MGVVTYLLLCSLCASFPYILQACTMEDVDDWRITQDLTIIDIEKGTFWNKTTLDILALTSISVGGGVNYANYLDVVWDANTDRFTISTSAGYEQYEENETSQTISFTVFFTCSGGATNSLIFDIAVKDTNNNPPTFKPNDGQYEFTVTPPLPPRFQITGCGGDDIVVRDIDLTTSSINFAIEDNPYFEIAYTGRSSSDPKEFLASLTTKDLIRNLSEDIELTIFATDVDGTEDPPITRNTTITVKADEAFLFPEEPVFAQPFHIATYENNQVVLDAAISLSQGFDNEVIFSLDGEYSNDFRLVPNGNEVSIELVNALSNEVLRSGRIVLVVKAEREYTSGATTTVIVQLPQVLSLAFEQTQYQGRIVDNVLETFQVTLAQGYQDGFNVSLQSEYATYFSTSVQGNVITLQMTPLEASIIDGNNFLSLLVVASNEYSSTTAVATLDIVKDDNVSPAFENAIYTGVYTQETGLAVEQIVLGQGYDQTVNFSLSGEHAEFFSITNTGAVITLSSSGVPAEIWTEQQLLLTIAASKPRAVTASTAIAIRLPAVRELSFALPIYSGTLQDTNLTLEAIALSVGYADDVNFTLGGDFATYFTLSPAQNGVAVNLSAGLPDDVIAENNFLTLTLFASGTHAVPTSTNILLEIMKQDTTTPVFSESIYAGAYVGDSIEIGNISLSQGYDDSITFRLEGEHAQYFQLSNVGNNLNLALVSDVPPDVIFAEQVLLFSVLAEKPLTVGAHATVSIGFSRDLTETTLMRFSQNTYIGSLENNNLVLDTIILETGYEIGTEFSLGGEYQSYFSIQYSENVVNVTMQNPLPQEIMDNNEFIILEIEATRERAVSIPASIVINISREEVTRPEFSNAYYKTVFADGNLENLTMTLSEGYDETVSFELQGDNSMWFSITNIGNNVQLALNTSMENIPDQILENNDYFLFSIIANKLNSFSARAAIFIHLPKETPETVLVQFSQASYVGRIENGQLYAPSITLTGEREPISFKVTGEYVEFFEVTQITPTNVEIRLEDGSLPANIDELPFIILDIEAQYPEAISGHTTVILEIVGISEVVTPAFEQAYYTGVYSVQEGLTLYQTIRLSQGFDETVVFTLAGDDAQWFALSNISQNNLTLILSNNELGQLTDRSHLVFSVIASKSNSEEGNAAIIINLSDYTTPSTSLRFAQNTYMGSIQNNTLTLDSIIMHEGYSSNLNISFTGDHVEYFQLTTQEDGFTLQLVSELPDSIIDDNKVLVFTIEANDGNSGTHTTIVLEIIKAELGQLSFEEDYYVGSYSLIDGFTFDRQMTLSEGYDENVLFTLEGESSQYFDVVMKPENSVALNLVTSIPSAVVVNNQHLIFTIVAEKPGNLTARATIVIALLDDYIEDMEILGFDRTIYLGSLENGTLNLEEITLINGSSNAVEYGLFGDLESYFALETSGSRVLIEISKSIPEHSLPENGVIILELEASATGAMSAHAVIVITVVQEETNTSLEQLVFSEVFYTGHYTETEGLTFTDEITLSEGFDTNVTFTLEGDNSQYFEAVVTSNSILLRIISPIPSSVVMNNHQLIFTVRADKPGAIAARATIVISLLDEFIENMEILGFDRITYLGSLENGTLNIEEITLVNNSSNTVEYGLFGDLESYFALETSGSRVSIILSNLIPEQSLPENGVIVLELEASAAGAMSAHAVIVITVVLEETDTNLEQLVFSEVFYTGHYTETGGLTFTDEITLSEGFDTNVTFTLEGDNSQYFEAVVTSNSISLRIISPIPSSVVMNNHQLIFTVRAEKPGAIAARATIVISLLDEFIENMEILGFNRITYLGSLENGTLNIEEITLVNNSSNMVEYGLFGDLEKYFALETSGSRVSIILSNPIPEQSLPENGVIVLELEASATGAMSAHAVIVITVVQEETNTSLEQLVFSEVFYTGHYTETEGLTFTDEITLSEGFDTNVTFTLEGDNSQYFEAVVTSNSILLRIISPIPSSVVMNNHQLIFTVRADKPGAIAARATIVISLLDEFIENMEILGFNRITYLGSLENGTLNIEEITLVNNSSNTVEYGLFGDLESYFALETSGSRVSIILSNPIPEQSLPENGVIVLELEASATGAMSAHAVIVITVVQEETNTNLEQLVFSEVFYTGHYTETGGLTFTDEITLSEGFDTNVTFTLEGDNSQYFEAVVTSNSISLRIISPIPSSVVMNNHQLIFTVRAEKPGAIAARATIVISLLDEFIENMEILGFDRITYLGSLENGTLNIEEITLVNNSSNTAEYGLFGDLESYFALETSGSRVSIILSNPIPEQSLPENGVIVLELEATATGAMSAHSVIVITVVQEETNTNLEQLVFSEVFYTGHYTETGGLTFTDEITLSEGFDTNVTFTLEGDNSQYFEAVVTSNSISLRIISPIPSSVVMNNHQLIFTVRAEKPGAIAARATIVISLLDDAVGSESSFGKILYEGIVQNGEVHHEAVTLSGYDGTDVQLLGENAALFSAIHSEGAVVIQGRGPVTLSPDVSYVALQLQAGEASAVLLLDVEHSENPELPSILFSSSSYVLSTDVTHTGTIGQVLALADNNEAVAYSLDIDNVHLLQRLSVSHDGELILWAPANNGVYNFDVIATTVFTRVSASVPVHLTVEAVTIIDENNYVLPPLQILNRDEESAHQNLVPFNVSAFDGCRFSLSNRWPVDQNWLYVDDNGLHTTAIDREHESIASMALSQIQVELVLECDGDDSTRSKRSVISKAPRQLEQLGPYDYGSNKWVLTDSINYNPRRSLVNLIVNDINDNAPIFEGKENEPIVVGYPVADLEERILPRALIQVKATDADVGENAAIVYSSEVENLAVSATTGYVHVRDIAGLENNVTFTIQATDRNGEGLTGTLDILVKLIDTSHIAVVTIQDAFLDDEQNILSNLSASVGYEVKALRSTVISHTESNEPNSRKKRETISSGASLQLYVYGLIEQEPVNVERLTGDINTSVIETLIIASTVSLENHLEICPLPGRDTALLVSTIVLAVVLFILIVAAGVWFFWKWRKDYEQFTDQNSLASQDVSVSPVPVMKPEQHSRMNIEDLKRSERRLQEMLETTPPAAVAPLPPPLAPSTLERTEESKVSIPEPPLVFQSFDKLKNADETDDEDEFGEVKKNRRKSVVTFNENVEKIIHIEDDPNDDPDIEVYRL